MLKLTFWLSCQSVVRKIKNSLRGDCAQPGGYLTDLHSVGLQIPLAHLRYRIKEESFHQRSFIWGMAHLEKQNNEGGRWKWYAVVYRVKSVGQ